MMKHKIYLFLFSIFCLQGANVSALPEMSDKEMSLVDGQSEGLGFVINDFSVGQGGDTGEIGFYNKSADAELSIKDLRLFKTGGGFINMGTPSDPIYINVIHVDADIIEDKDMEPEPYDIVEVSLPRQIASYTPATLSVLLTTKFSKNYLVRATVDGFLPVTRERKVNGDPVGPDIPTFFYVWSAPDQGLSLSADIRINAERIELQTDQGNGFKGRFVLHNVDVRSVFGHPGSINKALFHPVVFTTYNKGGDVGFRLAMKPASPSSHNMPLGHVEIGSVSIPAKDQQMILDHPNRPFVGIYGMQVQYLTIEAGANY